MVAGAGVSASLIREDRKRAIELLGSGQSFSVLIRSDRAAVAFIHGSNPDDFGNALRRSRVPLLNRTDAVIVPAPESTGVNFVRSALSLLASSKVFTVGSATPLLDAGIRVEEELRGESIIELPGGVRIVSAAPSTSWTALVESGTERYAIGLGLFEPDDGTAERFAGLAGWIQMDGETLSQETIEQTMPASIYVPAASMSGNEAWTHYDAMGSRAPHIVRVHTREVTRISLT